MNETQISKLEYEKKKPNWLNKKIKKKEGYLILYICISLLYIFYIYTNIHKYIY